MDESQHILIKGLSKVKEPLCNTHGTHQGRQLHGSWAAMLVDATRILVVLLPASLPSSRAFQNLGVVEDHSWQTMVITRRPHQLREQHYPSPGRETNIPQQRGRDP